MALGAQRLAFTHAHTHACGIAPPDVIDMARAIMGTNSVAVAVLRGVDSDIASAGLVA
jgi:hypothetical protein